MTDLTKIIKRRASAISPHGKRIVVALYPNNTIGFREERAQTEFRLPVEACYYLAADAHGRDLKKQKALEKKQREGERKARQ